METKDVSGMTENLSLDEHEPQGRWYCEKCGYLNGLDEVIVAIPDNELGVIVYGDGTISNRWEDGTIGFTDEIREAANQEVDGVCSKCKGLCTWDLNASFEKQLSRLDISLDRVVPTGIVSDLSSGRAIYNIFRFRVSLKRLTSMKPDHFRVNVSATDASIQGGFRFSAEGIMRDAFEIAEEADTDLDVICSERDLLPSEGVAMIRAAKSMRRRLQRFLGRNYVYILNSDLR